MTEFYLYQGRHWRGVRFEMTRRSCISFSYTHLSAGANPNCPNPEHRGKTAVMIAAQNGHADVLQLLLDAKVCQRRSSA